MQFIGFLGGTFDPIHNGHIHLAIEVQKKLKLDEIKLIPANIPPHRPMPIATSANRKKMVELAIHNEKKLSIDLREIENENISYTVNTLKSLRADFLDAALFLIVGEDVFNLIHNWKDWESLLNYTHIIVATRRPEKKDSMSDKLKKWRDDNKTDDIKILKSTLFGYIFYIDIPIVEISSTMIRQCYSTNETMDEYLPSNIITYIKENNLYIDN